MSFEPGTNLLHYRLIEKIGEGGMGVVYKALDTTLDREVAVKILPDDVVHNATRLARFEREAKAVAALAHPNIMAVFEFRTEGEVVFMVNELLEGQSLREALADGPLPARKAAEIARQVARGLAAAHAKGFVHRDLKPDNVFITDEGRAKILDFGLAASGDNGGLSQGDETHTPTATVLTSPGSVMGTVDYMSPEQARGEEVDHRSDIFSLGTLLYEMLTGVKPFHRDSAPETLTAVLREDPTPRSPDTVSGGRMPAALERVVLRCLEKKPAERFQSASDLAFAVENALGTSTTYSTEIEAVYSGPIGRRHRLWALPLLGVLLLAAGVLLGRGSGDTGGGNAAYTQLTYREGAIASARFAADGTVVYSAAWDDNRQQLYTVHQGSPESRPLGVEDAEILSISSKGELALLLQPRFRTGWSPIGTLARMPLGGGAPRKLQDLIAWAEWDPEGKELAIVRVENGQSILEYPPGAELYRTSGWIGDIRFAPDGSRIAFANHPGLGDDRGIISVVDLKGNERQIGEIWSSLRGVAWSPDSREVRFTAGRTGTIRGIYGMDLDGNIRVISSAPVDLRLHDIDADGRYLISRNTAARKIFGRPPGADREVPLSWLDWSFPGAISDDGMQIVFTEQGEGGGAQYGSYIRSTAGGPAVRLGQGQAWDLHPDGTRIISAAIGDSAKLMIYPTGTGQTRELTLQGFSGLNGFFTGRGDELVVAGRKAGGEVAVYLYDPENDAIRQISPEGESYGIALRNTNQGMVVVNPRNGSQQLLPLDGGDPLPIPGLTGGDAVVGWSKDGGTFYIGKQGQVPAIIERLDRNTGKREPFLELMPSSPAGLVDIRPVMITPDGKAYMYSFRRYLSTLYLGEGL